jgi:hypothetical protein
MKVYDILYPQQSLDESALDYVKKWLEPSAEKISFKALTRNDRQNSEFFINPARQWSYNVDFTLTPEEVICFKAYHLRYPTGHQFGHGDDSTNPPANDIIAAAKTIKKKWEHEENYLRLHNFTG